MNERLDSVWDLLVARIAALEAKVEALEVLVDLLRDELYAMRDEPTDAGVVDYDDTELWIGGNDGPDD